MDIKDSPTSAAEATASRVAAEARQAVSREMEDARARARSGADALRAQAADAGGAITSLVSEQAERRKDEAADGLMAFADAIRRASDDLGERDRSISARLVQEAAQGLERLAGGVQARSVAEMTRNVTTFGREHPATFLAGCLIAGVAVGRLMTSSAEAADDDRVPGGGYGAGPDRRYNPDGIAGGATGFAAVDAAATGTGVDRPAGGTGAQGTSRSGIPGAGVVPGGVSGGATSGGAARQAGVFGAPIAPSSADRAPGDLDGLGTRTDAEQSDSVFGEPESGGALFKDPKRSEGGRDGDL